MQAHEKSEAAAINPADPLGNAMALVSAVALKGGPAAIEALLAATMQQVIVQEEVIWKGMVEIDRVKLAVVNGIALLPVEQDNAQH